LFYWRAKPKAKLTMPFAKTAIKIPTAAHIKLLRAVLIFSESPLAVTKLKPAKIKNQTATIKKIAKTS